jgi:hypothetical protein
MFEDVIKAGQTLIAVQEEFNAIAKDIKPGADAPRSEVVALYTLTKKLSQAHKDFISAAESAQARLPRRLRRKLETKVNAFKRNNNTKPDDCEKLLTGLRANFDYLPKV